MRYRGSKIIIENIHRIYNLIRQAESASHRAEGSVQLLAVSKGHTYSQIEEAYTAGLRDFGENYLQEALPKIQALHTLSLNWHFIGPIQSNKTQGIAKHFSWVHSVSSQKIAQRLSDARPSSMPSLNICLQVNLDDESSKSGLEPNEIAPLAAFIQTLPGLHLRGLMLIPRPQVDEEAQYNSFLRLTALRDDLNQQLNLSLDTLSMGMSNDMQAAIRAGSTIVRIGSAIFGKRS